MIYINSLTKTYRTKYCKIDALKSVDLKLPNIGLVFITGKSGSGKSTLLNLLGGLDQATGGSILFNGVDVAKMKGKALDDYRRNSVGFVFQEFNLIKEYNIYDNIAVTLNLSGEKNNDERVTNALKRVELEGYEKRRVDELSGGQKQRVSIARALSTETDILLADEPTGNLDSVTAQEIFDILKKVSKEKLVVVVTHDRESADKYGDRIIELKDGRIISDRTAQAEKKIEGEITAEEDVIKEKDINGKCSHNKSKRKGMSLAYLTRLAFINIWKKKIRLIVTTLLFACTLTLFGFSLGIYSMDKAMVASQAVADIGIREIGLTYETENGLEPFSDEMITELNNSFDLVRLDKIYNKKSDGSLKCDFTYYTVGDNGKRDIKIDFYNNTKYIFLNDTFISDRGYKVNGKLPSGHLEIAISKYSADKMIADESLEGYVKTYSDILEKQYILDSPLANNFKIRVTGIIDTGSDDYYEILDKNIGLPQDDIYNIFNNDISFSPTTCIFVDSSFVKIHRTYIRATLDNSYYCESMFLNTSGIVKFIGERPLTNGEMIVSERRACDLAYGEGYMEIDAPIKDGSIRYNVGGASYKVVGYFTEDAEEDTPLNYIACIVSDDSGVFFSPFEVTSVNALLSGDAERDRAFFQYMFGDDETKDTYSVRSIVSQDVSNLWFMEFYQKLAYYLAIGFGVFSVVMMLNFIITSINSNKREIGILRALGMRMSGIFYMFVMEALIVCIIAFLIAVCLLFALVGWWNSSAMGAEYVLSFDYVDIGAAEVFSMLGLSMGIALVSSLIPILIKARITPIDIMRKY